MGSVLEDYETFTWRGHEFFILPAKGHTLGSSALIAQVDGRLVAFTGDLLAAAAVTVTVKEVRWVGLRCRVTVEPAVEGLLVDLWTKPNDRHSSVAEPKALGADGKAGLLVADDSLEGTIVSLVIVDASGRVACKAGTTVGGDH